MKLIVNFHFNNLMQVLNLYLILLILIITHMYIFKFEQALTLTQSEKNEDEWLYWFMHAKAQLCIRHARITRKMIDWK